jgi:hypothetical protein
VRRAGFPLRAANLRDLTGARSAGGSYDLSPCWSADNNVRIREWVPNSIPRWNAVDGCLRGLAEARTGHSVWAQSARENHMSGVSPQRLGHGRGRTRPGCAVQGSKPARCACAEPVLRSRGYLAEPKFGLLMGKVWAAGVPIPG